MWYGKWKSLTVNYCSKGNVCYYDKFWWNLEIGSKVCFLNTYLFLLVIQ